MLNLIRLTTFSLDTYFDVELSFVEHNNSVINKASRMYKSKTIYFAHDPVKIWFNYFMSILQLLQMLLKWMKFIRKLVFHINLIDKFEVDDLRVNGIFVFQNQMF